MSSMYEFWTRWYFHENPFSLENLVERVLQLEMPELVVEVRGGSGGHGDEGRDVVLKVRRSDPESSGVVQVSAQEAWQTKFRRELRAFIKNVRTAAGPSPDKWVFASIQPVHIKKASRRGAKSTNKDDELLWARETLQAENVQAEGENWGLQDFVSVIASPRGANIRTEFSAPASGDDSLDEVYTAFDAFTAAGLEGTSSEIEGLGHLQRTELQTVAGLLAQGRSVLLVGEGGAGKSALAAEIASRERAQGKSVLYLRASAFAPNGGIDAIEKRIAISGSLIGTLTRAAKARVDNNSWSLGSSPALL